jgi:hypothetical protein
MYRRPDIRGMASAPVSLDLIAFVEGLRNGDRYDESDVDELVANFGRFRGYWTPYVSVDHEQNQAWKALAFGDVTTARKGRVRQSRRTGKWERVADADRSPGTRAALVVTLGDVPPEVGEMVASGRLPRVSVEFFDHTSPFVGPQDEVVTTNVLKSVSLLGAQSEASKGMPRPTVRTFADRVGRRVTLPPALSGRTPKAFGAYPMRDQLIQTLSAAGIDVSWITDAVPDAALQSIVDAMGGTMPDDPAMFGDYMGGRMAGMDDDKQKAFKDAMKKFMDGGEKEDEEGVMVKTFGDKQIQTLITAAVQKAVAPLAPAIAHANRSAQQAKAQKIKAFGDRMTGANGAAAFMTPVQFAAVRPMLEKLDDAQVKQFSDKKGSGTALDEHLAALEAAYSTPVKTFGDRVPDAIGAGGGSMTAERRQALLKQTPEGRAVLAREKAKN